jgi:hypothetical protein
VLAADPEPSNAPCDVFCRNRLTGPDRGTLQRRPRRAAGRLEQGRGGRAPARHRRQRRRAATGWQRPHG